jgi:PAS domain S-box-containing protein
MDINRIELSSIKELLKDNPKGMTVTEISRSIKMNRHSVAKYMEVLVAAGHVDMRSLGPSKVYYLSQRVPISAMLSFSSDFIAILDTDLRVMNANDKFLEFIGLTGADALKKNISNFPFTKLIEPSLAEGISLALNGKEHTVDAYYKNSHKEYYFIVKLIPAIFEDGEKGVTMIMSDVTERKRIENEIRESEIKFRSVIEQSIDGVILVEENGTIIEFNQAQETISGIKREDVIGKKLWDTEFQLFKSDKRSYELYNNLRKLLPSYLQSGYYPDLETSFESNFKRPNGSEVSVLVTPSPIQTDKGFMLCIITRDITEKMRIERAVRESEEKFRNVAETTTSGILIMQDDRLVYANRGAEIVTGYTAEELTHINMMKFIHPDFLAIIQERTVQLKSSGIKPMVTSEEIKVINKNGEDRWIELSLGVMSLNGRPAIIKTFFDITKRKQAEEALRREHDLLETRVRERTFELERSNLALHGEIEKRRVYEEALRDSENKYRKLVENINDVAWEKDISGRFTYISPRIRDMMGYEPEQFLGKVILDFMATEEKNKISAEYWKLFNEPSTYSFQELHMKHKDGHDVILESNGSPCFDKDGKFYGYRGLARDITGRKNAESALMNSEMRYRTLVENINDISWEMDKEARFTYVSPKVRDILGFEPDHYLGKVITEFMPPEDITVFSEGFGRIFGNPRPYGLEDLRMYNKDGSVHSMEVNGTPFYDEHGLFCGFRGVTRDITKRKQTEEMLELMKHSLDRSEDAAFWIRPDASFFYVNDSASRMLGYSRDELLKMSVRDIAPGFKDEGWARLWSLIKRDKYHKMESVHRTKEGSTFLVDITANYLEFNGKEYDFAFVRPISPPKHKAAPQITTPNPRPK